MSAEQKSLAARLENVLAENDTCADCPNQRPLWASYLRWPKKGTDGMDESRMDESTRQPQQQSDDINVDIDGALGVIVCNDCAQHHHFELGKKRCLIKYLKYSHELTARDLDILEHSGNDLVNEYYEAHLWGSFQKELVLGDVEAEAKRRGKFIKDKYKKVLYRDHAGIAKAVQQCLNLQEYAVEVEESAANNNNKTSKSSSSRRTSTASTSSKKEDKSGSEDKIANAVKQIKRTKSGSSDYKRTNSKDKKTDGDLRRSSTSDTSGLARIIRQKENMRKTQSLDMTTNDDDDSDREEVPKYNPTGKTYTDEFNLETAKTKTVERAAVLKEFIEKGPDPKDDEFSLVLSGGEETDDDKDDANSQAGWGIHCLKSQLQVVKTLGKTEVRAKPARERGLNADPRRASTMALEQRDNKPKTGGLKIKRAISLDESASSLSSFRAGGRKEHMNANLLDMSTSALDMSSSNLTSSFRVRRDRRMSTSLNSSFRVREQQLDAAVKGSALDSSLNRSSTLDSSLKRSSTLDSSLKNTPRVRDPQLDTLQAKLSEVQSALQKTMNVAESLKKTAAMDASFHSAQVELAAGDKERGAPAKRGVLRRNSSLTDLDKLKKSELVAESATSGGKRGGRKKNTVTVETRRKKKKEEKKKLDDLSAPNEISKSGDRRGSASPRTRRRVRRGSSLPDLAAATGSDFMQELKKKMDGSTQSNEGNKSGMDESSNPNVRNRSRSRSGSVAPRRGGRRGSVQASDVSSNDESAAANKGSNNANGMETLSPRRAKRRDKSPGRPDNRRRTSMSDMSGSSTSAAPSRTANLSDRLKDIKGEVGKTGGKSVASMPVLQDRSVKRDRSRTRKARLDRSRSSSGERSDNSSGPLKLTRSKTSDSAGRRGKKRSPKRTSLGDLPALEESASKETTASAANTPALLTRNTSKSSAAKKDKESEVAKLPKNSNRSRMTDTSKTNDSEAKEAEGSKLPKNSTRSRLADTKGAKDKQSDEVKLPKNSSRSRSPRRDMHKSVNGMDVGGKLAGLPDMKPRTKKDAKSVHSMPARSRSSSSEKLPTRSARDRSRSPKKRSNAPDMHKSMSGVNLMQKMDEDLKRKILSKEAAGETTKTKESDSKGRSRSPKRPDMHKSLSGLLDDYNVRGSSVKPDGKSIATASLLGDHTKRKESEIKLPQNKSRTGPPKATVVLDGAKLGGMQDLQNDVDKEPSKTPVVLDGAELGGMQGLQNDVDEGIAAVAAKLADSAKQKGTETKIPKNKGRSRQPKTSFHLSHGVLDASKLGALEDLQKNFGREANKRPKEPGGKPQHKSKSRSPKKEMANMHKSVSAVDPAMLSTAKETIAQVKSRPPKKDAVNIQRAVTVDPEMLSSLTQTISQVRSLVGPPSEKDAQQPKSVASRKDRKRRSVATEIPESSEPDCNKLHTDMAEKMKQFKMRNEKVDNAVRSKRNRRRSSFSGSFSELANSDESTINAIVGQTLQGKKGKGRGKNDAKSPHLRRRSRSLDDLKKVEEDPEKAEERRYLRKHMNAMLDDSSGQAW